MKRHNATMPLQLHIFRSSSSQRETNELLYLRVAIVLVVLILCVRRHTWPVGIVSNSI